MSNNIPIKSALDDSGAFYPESHERAITDDNGTTLESKLQMLQNPIFTLNSAPTSSTLTHTEGGVTYTFKVGDQVRVKDTESGTAEGNYFVFFTLKDKSNNTAYWEESGSGGGSAPTTSTIVISLVSSQTGDTGLLGASIAVTIGGGTTTYTWDGNAISVEADAGSTYSIAATKPTGSHYVEPEAATGSFGPVGTSSNIELSFTKYEYGYIILDQSSTDPTQKVVDMYGQTYSNYTTPSVITAIRNNSHCYVGTFANNVMSLKQLDDSDGTMYADGTSAAIDIATVGKDVFMRLPEFYTKATETQTDQWKIEFAYGGNPGTDWKKWGGNDLIGKYEAYEASDLTYSVSGKTSTGSVSQANMKEHAAARGTGFSVVKWRHQNIMAILFYAYYGHTNCQSLIGSGANSNDKNTGLKNSLGMTDTTSANGNTDNIVFWGLENWWGNKYEWVDNVVINNHTWTITEDDGTTRTIQASAMASGNGAWIYPSKFILGDDLDTVAAAGQSGGSDSTGYCDGQYYTADKSRVVARSNYIANAYGGVACVHARYESSYTHADRGSRLAFTGTIQITE